MADDRIQNRIVIANRPIRALGTVLLTNNVNMGNPYNNAADSLPKGSKKNAFCLSPICLLQWDVTRNSVNFMMITIGRIIGILPVSQSDRQDTIIKNKSQETSNHAPRAEVARKVRASFPSSQSVRDTSKKTIRQGHSGCSNLIQKYPNKKESGILDKVIVVTNAFFILIQITPPNTGF